MLWESTPQIRLSPVEQRSVQSCRVRSSRVRLGRVRFRKGRRQGIPAFFNFYGGYEIVTQDGAQRIRGIALSGPSGRTVEIAG